MNSVLTFISKLILSLTLSYLYFVNIFQVPLEREFAAVTFVAKWTQDIANVTFKVPGGTFLKPIGAFT